MKKLVLCLLLISAPAFADHYGHHHHRPDWVAPAIGIGILGLSIGIGVGSAYHAPVYSPPVPVYTPPPVYYPTRYHYVTVWDPRCYCYKNILTPY